LCAEIAGKFGWAFVNVTCGRITPKAPRAWRINCRATRVAPAAAHVVPMASGSLLTKIQKGYQEFVKLGLVSESETSIHGAQATGCSPFPPHKGGLDFFRPVKPDTIAKSLAIGTPADGFYALKVMKDTGGGGRVTDDEIRDAIKLLAETEGIFAETAGGGDRGVAQKSLVGQNSRNDSAVLWRHRNA